MKRVSVTVAVSMAMATFAIGRMIASSFLWAMQDGIALFVGAAGRERVRP